MGVSPFDETMLQHNEAQLDFILEMYSIDNPTKLKFSRPGREQPGLEQVKAKAGWADVLVGKAREEYMRPHMPNTNILDALRRIGQGRAVQSVSRRK